MVNWTIRVRPKRGALLGAGWQWELRASGYLHTTGWARTREKAEAQAVKARDVAIEIRQLREEIERLKQWEDVT